jgi:hypothetical protein
MTSTLGVVFVYFIKAAYSKLILIWRIFNEIKKNVYLFALYYL